MTEQHTGSRVRRSSTSLVLALVAAFVLLVPLAYGAKYRERIMPGVSVAGVPVGGIAPAQAVERLQLAGFDPDAAVVVRVGEERSEIPAAASGVALDTRASVADAYRIGRGAIFPVEFLVAMRARVLGIDQPLRVVFDRALAESAVAELALAVDRPARDATLRINGASVEAAPGQAGRRVDQAGAVEALAAAARLGVWPLPEVHLPSKDLPAEVSDASDAVGRARQLLAGPLKLRSADESWEIAPAELGPMLTTTVRGGTVALDMDRARLATWLAPVTSAVSETARNPRFHFDAEARRLVLIDSGRNGRRIDLDATAQRILSAPEDQRRTVQIATSIIPPELPDTATAEELGIREVVHEETSRFVGSPPERIHNIGVAAAQFDGLLIAPDAVFSFNDHIGEVSPEAGYQKTKIIMDGATQDGVGGGVCQVSTTLFRAAFWAGLPIVERFPHGYRVAYYEQGAPVGLDATVFQPSPDLRFKNDTGRWLLVETSSDARKATVTFRLVGTKPVRDVRMDGPVVTDIVPPPAPRVEIDPGLPAGATNKIELARNGATVSLTRIIAQDGKETREVFASRYRPTGALTAISPVDAGTAAPEPMPTPTPSPAAP